MERMDNDVKIMGNIYGFDGGNFAGNVYDTEGLAPTIRTCIGGNQQPMVVEKLMTDKVPSIKIRQATKEGFIDCRIGGVRLGLPEQFNSQRPSNRGRERKSHNNDGEYP